MKQSPSSLLSFLLLCALLTVTACSGGKPIASDSREYEADAPREQEFLGQKTITGTLHSTKGNQAMVAGIILPMDYVTEPESRRWKERLMQLKGKKIEIKGDVYRYHCGPEEQCLEQGYIDHFTNIDYLKASD